MLLSQKWLYKRLHAFQKRTVEDRENELVEAMREEIAKTTPAVVQGHEQLVDAWRKKQEEAKLALDAETAMDVDGPPVRFLHPSEYFGLEANEVGLFAGRAGARKEMGLGSRGESTLLAARQECRKKDCISQRSLVGFTEACSFVAFRG